MADVPLMENPMTTGGDVIYGGASGAPTRLANGTAGKVLTSAGTTLAPTWETPGSGIPATIFDAAGDIIVASAADTAARLAIGANTYVLTSNGTTAAWAAPSGGGGALAISSYAGSGGDTTYTTTSTTFADVDATNVNVTFTAPASGNVLVRVYLPGLAVAGSGVFLNVRESTTNVTTLGLAGASSGIVPVYMPFYVTGISAGSHTYKLGWHTESSVTATLYYGNTTRGAIIMEVWEMP